MPGVKIIAFEVRDDERAAFQAQMKRWGVEVKITSEIPSLENVEMVSGFKGVTMLGQGRIDRPLLEEWAKRGVGFISTRTIGYDHIDLEAARELGDSRLQCKLRTERRCGIHHHDDPYLNAKVQAGIVARSCERFLARRASGPRAERSDGGRYGNRPYWR